MYAFEFTNVMFAYPGHVVLEKFNFQVAVGDFVAVIGPNGAGKSTLLKLCAGLLKPASGQVRIVGEPITQFQNWKSIAYISQNPLRERSFPVTAAEVVAMGRVAPLGLGKSLRREDRDIINQSLELVGMYGHRHSLIGRFSGGQQQRIMLARALAAKASILMLDEPTTGLDNMATENIYGILKQQNINSGITILAISHDVEGIAKYAGKVVKVDNGIACYDPSAFAGHSRTHGSGTAFENGLAEGRISHA